MSFTAETVFEQLQGSSPGSRFAVAYSGGLDSTVLLYAMHQALALFNARHGAAEPFALRAIHVNHGLSPAADRWQALCAQTCARLGIPLHSERVEIALTAGASLERLAREKRYAVFACQLAADECLLMAHHLDDQAETFLLRSLRGAGPKGLSAIPLRRPLGQGHLLRPLLQIPRSALQAYAEQQGLDWVEDESNDSQLFDRNYCRHAVLPLLEARWPSYRESWRRSAQLCDEAAVLLDELATLDFEQIKTPVPTVIDALALQRLSAARQRNTLRYWLALVGAPDPGWNVLTHIVAQLLPAAGAQPQIRWRGDAGAVVLRRFRKHLYLSPELPAMVATEPLLWQVPDTLHLPQNGFIYAQPCLGEGLLVPAGASVTLRYRQGGESCRLHGRRTRPLKKILQDADLVPWLRERVPLVYCAQELVCIPGLGVCDGWQAGPQQAGWRVIWMPPDASVPR